MDRRHFVATAATMTLGLSVSALNGAPRHDVLVIGVGGAGANIVREVWKTGLEAEYWVLDRRGGRDPAIPGARRILVPGETSWTGEDLPALPAPLFRVAVVGGLGGTTGSAVLPALVGVLLGRGVCIGSYCTLPFRFEGVERQRAAAKAHAALMATGAIPRIVRNDDLLRSAKGKSLGAVLREGDGRLVRAIQRFLLAR